MPHKAGFVNIIGNPNVGKSTLMNALVGERLSVITSKAQTTRHRIMGLVNGEDYQIVFSDTPGILDPNYLLQESMMREVGAALEDADIFLLVIDVNEGFEHPEVLSKIINAAIPTLVLLNKIDLSTQEKVMTAITAWKQTLPEAEILPLSAIHGFNVDTVIDRILEKLPECPAYYDKNELTDRPERFFVSEIIRSNILELYRKEVPYSVEVVIESFVDEEHNLTIGAEIFVARESQKIILIGEQGHAIKRLGITARMDLEKFFGKHIHLDLRVKVSKDWREDKNQLRKFGYPI
ncbi:MAG: GTPase Era [Bacteroidota bacterium]